MIAGSLAPFSGYVRVAGFDMAEQPAAAKSCIGYLPEVPPLYPEMTVREYLRFACDLKNAASKNTEADNTAWMQSIVRELEIEGHMSVLIRNLSKGYRQRVGIAAAIAGKPALLLLDEPVSGLDPRQAAEFRSMLKRICSHMAVIISSHGLLEIASLCTRVIIMKEGRIVADGNLDELTGSSGDLEALRSSAARLEDLFISLTKP
jgi:ABC-2 type transport system ATP-binding protein